MRKKVGVRLALADHLHGNAELCLCELNLKKSTLLPSSLVLAASLAGLLNQHNVAWLGGTTTDDNGANIRRDGLFGRQDMHQVCAVLVFFQCFTRVRRRAADTRQE